VEKTMIIECGQLFLGPGVPILLLNEQDIHGFCREVCLSCRKSCRISYGLQGKCAYPVENPAGYPRFCRESVPILSKILQDIHTLNELQ